MTTLIFPTAEATETQNISPESPASTRQSTSFRLPFRRAKVESLLLLENISDARCGASGL